MSPESSESVSASPRAPDSADRIAGIVAVVTDLIFDSKIRGAAQSQGLPCRSVRTPQALADALSQESAALVIVDMELPQGLPTEAIHTARSHKPTPVVMAYLPHVRTDLAEAANQADADLALPRSQFSAQLPQLLRRYATAGKS